jgi:hexulose-6-phosphate isomerase
MIVALNAFRFDAAMPVGEQLEATRAAGFEGVELVVTERGALTPATTDSDCARLAEAAAAMNVRITGLASGLFFERNYAAADVAVRCEALELTRQMLRQAAALKAETGLVVPAVVGRHDEATPRVAYADALNRTYAALRELRHEAEDCGVCITIENMWSRFLLSPVEAAELLDRVNSPCVGFCVDVGNVLAYGYPQDWITTLGGRVRSVHVKDYDVRRGGRDGFVAIGEGSVDWPAVRSALDAVRYDGSLIYEGGGDAADARQRIRRVLRT